MNGNPAVPMPEDCPAELEEIKMINFRRGFRISAIFLAVVLSPVMAFWSTDSLAICGNGIIDPSEQCDDGSNNGGAGSCCTTDCQLAAAFTVCDASDGPCELAAVCSGNSALCPNKEFVAAGTVCDEAEGPCELDAVCSGDSALCPDNKLVAVFRDRFEAPETQSAVDE